MISKHSELKYHSVCLKDGGKKIHLIQHVRCLNSWTKFFTDLTEARSSRMTGSLSPATPVRRSISSAAASPLSTDRHARYTRAAPKIG